MDSSLRKLVGLGLGAKDQATARHRTTSAAPSCESLEGRQLLSTAGAAQGAVPTLFTQGAPTGDYAPTSLSPAGGVTDSASTSDPYAWLFSESSTSTSTSDSSSSTSTSSTGSTGNLKTDLSTLQSDLTKIHNKSGVTPAQLSAITIDSKKLEAESTSSPSQASVTTFMNDLKAVGNQLPSADQTTQLATDLTAVFTSAGITDQGDITQTISDLEAIITSSNVTSDDLATIATDLTAVQNDAGQGAGASDSLAISPLAVVLGQELNGGASRSLGANGAISSASSSMPFGWLLKDFAGPLNQADAGSTSSSDTSATSGSTGSTGDVQTALSTLQSDLTKIYDKSSVTPAQIAAVTADSKKLQAEATSAPTQSTVTTLINDLKAVGNQVPTSDQATQLKADFTAVLNSAGITDQDDINQAISDLEAVFTSSNITADDLATIATDQTAVQNALGTSSTDDLSTNPIAMAFALQLNGGATPTSLTIANNAPSSFLNAGGPDASWAYSSTGQGIGMPSGGGTMHVFDSQGGASFAIPLDAQSVPMIAAGGNASGSLGGSSFTMSSNAFDVGAHGFPLGLGMGGQDNGGQVTATALGAGDLSTLSGVSVGGGQGDTSQAQTPFASMGAGGQGAMTLSDAQGAMTLSSAQGAMTLSGAQGGFGGSGATTPGASVGGGQGNAYQPQAATINTVAGGQGAVTLSNAQGSLGGSGASFRTGSLRGATGMAFRQGGAVPGGPRGTAVRAMTLRTAGNQQTHSTGAQGTGTFLNANVNRAGNAFGRGGRA